MRRVWRAFLLTGEPTDTRLFDLARDSGRTTPASRRKGPIGNRMSKRLFVGNLSYSTSETDLNTAFAPWGGCNAAIPTDRDSGRTKGFGFVEVDDDQMKAAINTMDGKELGGRNLTVNEARPREERGGGGYGGGRGGGGYGGGGGRRW